MIEFQCKRMYTQDANLTGDQRTISLSSNLFLAPSCGKNAV
jgi:hypothetical protein